MAQTHVFLRGHTGQEVVNERQRGPLRVREGVRHFPGGKGEHSECCTHNLRLILIVCHSSFWILHVAHDYLALV